MKDMDIIIRRSDWKKSLKFLIRGISDRLTFSTGSQRCISEDSFIDIILARAMAL